MYVSSTAGFSGKLNAIIVLSQHVFGIYVNGIITILTKYRLKTARIVAKPPIFAYHVPADQATRFQI